MAKDRKKTLADLDASYLEAMYGEIETESIQTREPVPERPEAAGSSSQAAPRETSEQQDPLEALRVVVAADAMQASIKTVSPFRLESRFDGEGLLEFLRKKGVIFGIDQDVIEGIVAAAKRPGGWQGEAVVAEGSKPQARKIELSFLQDFDSEYRGRLQTGKAQEPEADLHYLFQVERLDIILQAAPSVRAVETGEVLATISTDQADLREGRDVLGFPKSRPNDHQPQPGENILLDADSGRYVAQTYGYLQFRDNRLSVIPPIWISPDRMQAWFVPLPQVGSFRLPAPADLEKSLKDMGIKEVHVRQDEIANICRGENEGHRRPAIIAQGNQGRPGRDAEIELFFNTGQQAGAIRENDTIDLRERNLIINVRTGELLARKVLATKGTPGFNLFGERVPTPDGRELILEAKQGIAVKKGSESCSYFADSDGIIMFSGKSLAVVQMFHTEGDVDYNTGNLNVTGDIHIAGTIRPGFSVKSGGSVIVEGLIETGASLFVNGDLIVQHGIIGEGTRVIVHGSLRTMFIQDAEVMVKGDIWVGSHIYNGSVRSAGSLTVQRGLGTRGGRVVGGLICAADTIKISTVGSAGNQNTLLALQPDPEKTMQVNQLDLNVKTIAEQIARIIRTLGLESADAESMRALLTAAPAGRKKLYVELLANLSRLMKYQRHLKETKNILQQEMTSRLREASISISREIYQGSRVQIGKITYEMEQDLGPTLFRLADDRIVMDDELTD